MPTCLTRLRHKYRTGAEESLEEQERPKGAGIEDIPWLGIAFRRGAMFILTYHAPGSCFTPHSDLPKPANRVQEGTKLLTFSILYYSSHF